MRIAIEIQERDGYLHCACEMADQESDIMLSRLPAIGQKIFDCLRQAPCTDELDPHPNYKTIVRKPPKLGVMELTAGKKVLTGSWMISVSTTEKGEVMTEQQEAKTKIIVPEGRFSTSDSK